MLFLTIANNKKNIESNKVDNCEQSKLFKLAKSLLHSKEKTSLPDYKTLITLVNEFNQFFITKISSIHLKLESARHVLPPRNSSSPTSIATLTEFQSLTSEIESKLIKSASSATCAVDPMPPEWVNQNVLKYFYLSSVIWYISPFFQSGEFPTSLKIANVPVCPFLIKPSLGRNELKNYLPELNLAFISKLIEKAVAAQLNDHLSENNLIE